MNEEIKVWHVRQAQLIRKDIRAIQKGETALAWHRWELGEKLTETYGVYDGSAAKSIPVEDKAELAHIYGVPISDICISRRVYKYASTREAFGKVVDDYESWRDIVNGWLTDRTPEQIAEVRRAQKTSAQASNHAQNIPDNMRDGLMALGLSRNEAREAVYEFLSSVTPADVKRIWEFRTRQTAA